MVARDPWTLPLAGRYTATENSIAASLNMMNAWNRVTGVKKVGQYLVDEPAGQVLVTANVDEGGMSTLFYGRLKIENELITELELYSSQARGGSGFVMLADEIGTLPAGWTSPIPEGQRATREELLQLGKAIFDDSLPAPDPSPDCVLMECGGVVYEDPEYVDLLFSGEIQPRESFEMVTMIAGLGPGRPSDPDARVVAVDEDQGIVVAVGVIPGFVTPYVVRNATESCFVPAAMIDMHNRTLRPEMFPGRHVLLEMPAVAVNVQMVRMHSGKLQGMQLFNNLVAPGGTSPWVART
jgi:hypothetical protein